MLPKAGRGLVHEPYLATVVLSGTLIDALGNDAQKESLISAIVGGELRLALAAYEPEGRYDHTHVATQAEKQGDSYVISGSKAVVLHGDSADKLVVIARTGVDRGREGLSAFVVDADANGVSRRGYETIDGLRAAEIHFDNASGELLVKKRAQRTHWKLHLPWALWRCVRKRPVPWKWHATRPSSTSRSVSNLAWPSASSRPCSTAWWKCAWNWKARSMTILAACSLDAAPQVRAKRLAAAKAIIGKSGRKVAEEAIQLHGGMGMMEETAVSHYAKRIVMIDHQLGDLGYHMQMLKVFWMWMKTLRNPVKQGGLGRLF